MVAFIDLRHNKLSDWNHITTVWKVSDDGGYNFSEERVLYDLAHHPENKEQKSAFAIDSSQLNAGDKLFTLIDMFPKSRGFFTVSNAPGGSGYKNINDENYQILSKFGDSEHTYYISPRGEVYKASSSEENLSLDTMEKIDGMRVVKESNQKGFTDLGDIYQGEERIGNIYRGKVDAAETGEDFDGEYIVNKTAYLWLTHSNDNGETYSSPVDITPQVKKDYMSFLGTGPGIGIKLKNGEHAGRLLFPVYYTTTIRPNDSGPRVDGSSQQSALIYSDDNGQTWSIGESVMEGREVTVKNSPLTLSDQTPKLGGFQLTESQVVELNSGVLKLFARGFNNSVSGSGAAHIVTSLDGGQTFENIVEQAPFPAAYSQVAALHYGNIGEDELVLVSVPGNRDRRVDGTLHLARVKENNTFEWIGSKVYKEGSSAYSSIAVNNDGDVVVLYEGEAGNIYSKVLSIDAIAPEYNFKAILPYPIKQIKEKYSKATLSNIYNSFRKVNFDEIDENDLEIKLGYNIFNKSKIIDLAIPFNKYFGSYSQLDINDNEISLSSHLLAQYEWNNIKMHQTLGIDYKKIKPYEDQIRGYDLIVEPNYLAFRMNSQVEAKLSNKKDNFAIIPKLRVDFSTAIDDKAKVTANDTNRNTEIINPERSLGVKVEAGASFKYKIERATIGFNTYLYQNYATTSLENNKYSLKENGYRLGTNVDYTFSNNLGITYEMNYSKSKNQKAELGLKLGMKYKY